MKHNTTEVLRRGIDLTIANWPLLAMRIVESIVLFAVIVGAVVATIVPIAISAGLGQFHVRDIASAPDAFLSLLVDHWVLIVYALIVVTIVMFLIVAIHSFFDAGMAQVLIDSEHANAKPAFDMSRWLLGGREGWWAVFWIYNLVWTIVCVVLLLPLAATLAGMIAVTENKGRIVIGCAGLLVTFLLFLPAAIVAALWTEKAIAICVARGLAAIDSMRAARQEIARDLGRHLAVAFLVLVVSIGGAILISAISAPMSILRHQQPMMLTFLAPAQIVVSLLQSVFSAATGTWFLASYIAITEER